MKIVNFSKEYFNSANKIVFWLTGLSFAWISGYKFFWIDMNPQFINADKTADVIYTICTSVVASGLFYLFTIYIPKCYEINMMKKQMIIYIIGLEKYQETIIEHINKGNTKDKYLIDEFMQNVFNKNVDIERDFIKYYSIPKINKILLSSIKCQFEIFKSILENYSDLLPIEIKRKIVNITIQGNGSLQEYPIVDTHINYYYLHKLHFVTFKEVLKITNQLKHMYIIKWNNTMNMQIRF